MYEIMDDVCCITCRLSIVEEAKSIDKDDRLYCSFYKKYVAEDDYCNKYK